MTRAHLACSPPPPPLPPPPSCSAPSLSPPERSPSLRTGDPHRYHRRAAPANAVLFSAAAAREVPEAPPRRGAALALSLIHI
eukprot:7979568-Pyramimonas_sp.AAC.1